MTPQQRASIENGIWLCQICGKLVDNDEERFTAGVLEEWKRIAEDTALIEVRTRGGAAVQASDVELVRFFAVCFDRPAFQDPFHQEGSMEAFDQAIEQTITAINTGTLLDRDGHVRLQAGGKAFLKRHDWRRDMDSVVDLLRAIRSRFALGVSSGEISVGQPAPDGRCFYAINNRDIAAWMDETRRQVIELVSILCRQAHVPELHFPRPHPRRL